MYNVVGGFLLYVVSLTRQHLNKESEEASQENIQEKVYWAGLMQRP